MTTGGWIFSILGMLIVLALVVGVLVLVARGSNDRRGRADAPSLSAQAILDRRLASGEINVEEYGHLGQTLGMRAEGATESPPGRPDPTHG